MSSNILRIETVRMSRGVASSLRSGNPALGRVWQGADGPNYKLIKEWLSQHFVDCSSTWQSQTACWNRRI